MEDFLNFVMFVCVVLSAILFFKVWRMANDIHALRKKFAPKEKEKGKFDDVPATWKEADREKQNVRANVRVRNQRRV